MLEEIRNNCLKLKGTTENIKWENHLCFCVAEKMYLVTAPDTLPVSASFKASDEDFELLINRDGIIPAPYMARHKWVHIDNIERFSIDELSDYARKSYELVKSKLPRKVQSDLN